MKKVQLLKRRDFGSILNDTFAFLSENMKRYSKAFLYVVMPPLLVLMVVMTFLFNELGVAMTSLQHMHGFDFQSLSSFFSVYAVMIVLWSVVYLLQSLLIYEYLLLYEAQDESNEITTEALWAAMKADLMQMVGSYLGLIALIVLFFAINVGIVALVMTASKVLGGFLIFALVLAWIYLFLPISNFYMIRLRERLGILESLSRCFTLIRSNWWRTLGVLTIMGMAASALQMVVTAPLSVTDLVTTFQRIKSHSTDMSGMYTPAHSITQAISMAVGLFVSTIVSVATAINYYSLVESTDNTSLLSEIDRIGEKPDPEYKQEGEF